MTTVLMEKQLQSHTQEELVVYTQRVQERMKTRAMDNKNHLQPKQMSCNSNQIGHLYIKAQAHTFTRVLDGMILSEGPPIVLVDTIILLRSREQASKIYELHTLQKNK